MIYVTGDLHGDPARLSDKALRRLKKGDTLLVCGDFGFVWDGSPAELKLRRKIGKQKYTTIFVAPGTHDNLPMHPEVPGGGIWPAAQWRRHRGESALMPNGRTILTP